MGQRTTGSSRNQTFDAGETDTIACPICRGGRRNCRYCEGYGDVHPDDVDTIMVAYHAEKRNKALLMGVGGVLFIGLLCAVFMIVQAKVANQTESENGEGADVEGSEENSTSGGSSSEGKKDHQASTHSKDITKIIVDMRWDMRVKDYGKVIQKGEAALIKTTDKNQRMNLEIMIKEAKKKLTAK